MGGLTADPAQWLPPLQNEGSYQALKLPAPPECSVGCCVYTPQFPGKLEETGQVEETGGVHYTLYCIQVVQDFGSV